MKFRKERRARSAKQGRAGAALLGAAGSPALFTPSLAPSAQHPGESAQDASELSRLGRPNEK